MWELDHKENWALKNWCFWTVVLEETLESPLDCREIRSVDPKGSKSWIFIGRNWCWSWSSNTWPPDAKSRLTGKDPDAGENWGQEKKGATEDELVRWHHRLWGRWWRTGMPGVLQSIASQSWALLNDWTAICVQMKGMKVGLQRKGCGKEDTPPQGAKVGTLWVKWCNVIWRLKTPKNVTLVTIPCPWSNKIREHN